MHLPLPFYINFNPILPTSTLNYSSYSFLLPLLQKLPQVIHDCSISLPACAYTGPAVVVVAAVAYEPCYRPQTSSPFDPKLTDL